MTVKPNQLAPSPNAEVAQVVTPATGAGKGIIFMKDVGAGQIEAFFADQAGVEVQITTGGAVSGESNDGVNVGGGIDLFRDKTGVDLNIKTLIAGANVSIIDNGDDVTIAATNTGEGNTGSAQGTGVPVFIGKTGIDLQFRNILAGANTNVTQVGSDVVIESTVPAGGGEANTVSMVGVTGVNIYKQKTGFDFELRKIKAGSGMTIIDTNPDEIELVATAGTGEANTGQNVGSGTGNIFKVKTGTVLEFKRLLAGTDISISDGTDEITIAYTGSGGGASVLNDLTDTTIATPLNDQVLTYETSSGKWKNKVATGGGGASVDEVKFELPAAATIAARIAGVTNLPAGWSLETANTAAVTQFGTNIDTLIITWDVGLGTKVAQEISVYQETTGTGPGSGFIKFPLTASGEQKTKNDRLEAAVYLSGKGVDPAKNIEVYIKLI